MDRQQIIAAIDAEIARLEHARLLITQSSLTEQKRHPALARRKQVRERNEDPWFAKLRRPLFRDPCARQRKGKRRRSLSFECRHEGRASLAALFRLRGGK